MIKGVHLTDLKVIPTDKGEIRHAMKCSEDTFESFGEAYFSEVHHEVIKGWKLHKEMILNIVVPVGKIKFVIYNEESNDFDEFTIGEGNYKRLTISPGNWVAFQGVGDSKNILLNIASIEHDPKESIERKIDEIQYKWD